MSLETGDTSGDSWGSWLQNIGDRLITGYVNIEATKTAQLGQRGYYIDGQPGYYAPANRAQPALGAGMSSGVMLLAGAAVLLLLLRKG